MVAVNRLNSFKILIALCFVIIVLYHNQIQNNFTFLLGDVTGYDNTIHTSILEHWFNVFKGSSKWSEVGYFYPYTRTIAQTDGYLLTGIIYSLIRIFGVNPYISTEFVLIILKIIGFFGSLILSQKVFRLNLNHAILIATLFSLNNAMTSHGYRVQLATIAFAPWLFYIHFKTIIFLFYEDKKNFFKLGSLSMIIWSFWCLTCFYMAWFYAFFLLIFLVFLIILFYNNLKLISQTLKKMIYSITAVIVISLTSMYPFIYTYYPKSLETGTREYVNINFSTLTIENLFQLGNSNYFYTPLYNKFISKLSPNYIPDKWEYYNMGVSFFIFLLFVIALVSFNKKQIKSVENKVLKSSLLTTFFCLILILQWEGESLWKYVFNFVPGAKALGVINIFVILLSLPLYIGAISLLSRLNLNKIIFYTIAIFLILTELNKPLLELDRVWQSKMNLNFKKPTFECQSFFVSGWNGQEKFYGKWEWINNQYAHNISAMMTSQLLNIPTLNGMASFIPKDYDLVGPNGSAFSPNSQEYAVRIKDYIDKNNLTNVCRLDLNNNKWTKWN